MPKSFIYTSIDIRETMCYNLVTLVKKGTVQYSFYGRCFCFAARKSVVSF